MARVKREPLRADDHADMAGRDLDPLGPAARSRRARSGRRRRSGGASGGRRAMRRCARRPASGPARWHCRGTVSRSARARRERAAARPHWPIPPARRSAAPRRWSGSSVAEMRELGAPSARDRATRRRPAAPPSAARRAPAPTASNCAHMSLERGARLVGIVREIPRRREGDQPGQRAQIGGARSPSSRRGNSRAAPAARSSESSSGSRQLLDMAGDVEVAAAPRPGPSRAAARGGPSPRSPPRATSRDRGRGSAAG